MHSLKKLLPWLFAGCCAIPLFLLGMAVLFTFVQLPKEESVASPPTHPVDTLSWLQAFGEEMVSKLSLSPPEQTDGPTRLVASIIENHQDARAHQKGLQEALMVIELIVEGDISRFLAIYPENTLPERIGPVRSLRPHFVSIANGYKPLLLHAGGSSLAYDALSQLPDLIHHDGLRFDGETYERDPSIPPPHNLFIDKEAISSVLTKEPLTEFSLPLFETTFGKPHSQSGASVVAVDFGSPPHNVTYTYDENEQMYIRSVQGASDQANVENILILEAFIVGYGEAGAIPWTQSFGEGKLFLFREGKVVEGTWQREEDKPFQVFDSLGEELRLSPGKVWLTMLPHLGKVTWE